MRRAALLVILLALSSFSCKPVSGPPLELAPLSGRQIFMTRCIACHQPDGSGIPGICPPLATSPRLKGNPEHLIRLLLLGMKGPITRDGRSYNSIMPAWKYDLTDLQIAEVINDLNMRWNPGGPGITEEMVRLIRAETAGQKLFPTEKDLTHHD